MLPTQNKASPSLEHHTIFTGQINYALTMNPINQSWNWSKSAGHAF
jgi:hypothetical protein